MSFNWNDLKYLLAVIRYGRISKAAEELGSDPTTVSRRIKALEQKLDTALFRRIDGKYCATEALLQVVSTAESVEQQLHQFQAQLTSQNSHLSGRVRITSVHTFINYYLIDRLTDFYRHYPDIELEIIADSSQLDLGRHEADLAIRMGRPEQASMVTRRLSHLYYSVYAHRSLIDRLEKVEQLPWIVLEDRYSSLPESKWQRMHYPDAKVRLSCNVGPAMFNAVKAGLGIACLPCYMGQAEPELVNLREPFSLRELWLLMHQDNRNLARVRVFIDWLIAQFNRDSNLFMGIRSA